MLRGFYIGQNFRSTQDGYDLQAESQPPSLPGVNQNLKSVQSQKFNKNVN